MRINKFIAQATGMSRRAADTAIADGRVLVNNNRPDSGQQISDVDSVTIDGQKIEVNSEHRLIMLNKPVGYVCSRDGQGNRTIYDLLPENLHNLKPIGRLDKHSSGLLLLTDDGQLAYELTHPKFQKTKKYKVALNRDLSPDDYDLVTNKGVMLDDGPSRFELEMINKQAKEYKVVMTEGRNRQIRRTFEALGYNVVKLHRTHIGPYALNQLGTGKFDFKEI